MEFHEKESNCLILGDLTKAENDITAIFYIDCHKS